MLKRLPDHPVATARKIRFTFGDQLVDANVGDTVASALLLNNIAISGQRFNVNKAPFCMMGACYECLVEINGQSVQSCMVKATDGLRVTPLLLTDIESPGESGIEKVPDDDSS